MTLKIADVAELLHVTTKTVYRWVHADRIPFYKVNHHYRFKQQEIDEWLVSQGRNVSTNPSADCPFVLTDLIRRGGIHYCIEGKTPCDAITNAMWVLPMHSCGNSADLLSLMIQREEIQSTGIGVGISVPHPRTQAFGNVADEFIAICMLDTPLAIETIDNEPIHTMIIVVCANEVRHFRAMAHIGHLCRQDAFISLLKNHAPRTSIIELLHSQLPS